MEDWEISSDSDDSSSESSSSYISSQNSSKKVASIEQDDDSIFVLKIMIDGVFLALLEDANLMDPTDLLA